MKFGPLCSGIEAASIAWNPLGWKAEFFSEIEKFPCRLLQHYYPDVPNHGDMTKFKEWPDHAIDLLCGGTPCQGFSIAGLGKGLDDPRSRLMLTYVELAAKLRPRWIKWENVFGCLSTNRGQDFATFLGLLSGRKISVPKRGWGSAGIIPGYKNAYGIAYRIFDARFFGVPQRRRRVFVVGYLGDWRPAATVLFEQESLRRDFKETSRPYPTVDCGIWRKRQCNQWIRNGFAIVTASRVRNPTPTEIERLFGFPDGYTDWTKAPIYAGATHKMELQDTLWHDRTASECNAGKSKGSLCDMPERSSEALHRPLPHYREDQGNSLSSLQYSAASNRERRLSASGAPIPKPIDDGPRYKALGNSWAVPNVHWIGKRIDQVDKIMLRLKNQQSSEV